MDRVYPTPSPLWTDKPRTTYVVVNYRTPPKDGESNVFTGTCLSTVGEGRGVPQATHSPALSLVRTGVLSPGQDSGTPPSPGQDHAKFEKMEITIDFYGNFGHLCDVITH